MRKRLPEETFLFISVIKWVVLATIIGTMVGLATTAFVKILSWSISFSNQYSYYYMLLPFALLVSVLIVKYLAPEAEGHGTEKVIEAVHKRNGKINPLVVPVKLIATVITLAFGGSVGKEGPAAQIGAGLSSFFADLFRFSPIDREKLVICGISGGFAAIFGTPIAGAMFGVEVLFVGSLMYDVLLPSFIAGITSFQVSKWLGVTYFYHPLQFVSSFSELFFLKVILAGIFFGLCSIFLIEILRMGGHISERIPIKKTVKGLIGGVLIILLTLTFSKEYLGLGLNTVQSSLEGTPAPWYAFLVKGLFTTITLNFGGSGGIVTPIFYVGTTSGTLFARIMDLNISTFAAIGMVALLAGAANTPISASIMAVELFGPKVAPYAAVACVISFLMTGHRSVYPSQVLAFRKESKIQVELGKEVEDTIMPRQIRSETFLSIVIRSYRKLKRSLKK